MSRVGLIFALGVFLCGVAHAQPAKTTYEDERTARALEAASLKVDEAAEGKRIAFVRLVRQEVFADDELMPTVFNLLHRVTDEDVIMRELLVKSGQVFDARIANLLAETRRNLRALGIFALVRVVPVQVSTPGEVGVLVYTRDVWSLRLEQRLQFNGGQLDELNLQLTELNLFGRGKKAAARFQLRPFEYAAGQVYADRRLLGGELALFESGDLIFERETGGLEGGRVSVRLDKPLRTLDDHWSAGLALLYDQRIVRQTSGGQLLKYDNPVTPEVESLDRQWEQRVVGASLGYMRQAGDKTRYRYGGGLGFSDFSAESEGPLRPLERRRVFPFLSVGGFFPEWRTYTDLATYGLSEELRLGPSWSMRVSAPMAALGSTTDGIELDLAVSEVVAIWGDGLLEGSVGAEADVERGGHLSQLVYGRARVASPSLHIGRLVSRADLFARRLGQGRQASTLVTLGGDNGLRGYPSQAFHGFGDNLARASVEWRTRPLVLSSIHLGGVLFYDAGSVYRDVQTAKVHQAVGIGARWLVPQFNRVVYRLDVGVPLEGSGLVLNLSGGSNQATPMTEFEDDLYEVDVGGLSVQPSGPAGLLQ